MSTFVERGDGNALLLDTVDAARVDPVAEGMLLALPEPALLVTEAGAIVAVNGSAAQLLGRVKGALAGTLLLEHVSDEPGKIASFLASCARSRSPIPGALNPRTRAGSRSADEPSIVDRDHPGDAAGAAAAIVDRIADLADGPRRRVTGAVVRPAAPGVPALILLRFRPSEGASDRFHLLNSQIAELTREVRARRRAEAALLDANVHLHEQTRAAESLRLAAEQANRAKSEFLAVMSHELRTPLNAIGGYVELLELGIRGPITDAQRDDLERIQRAQRHLLMLISEVLNFARLEARQVRYSFDSIKVDTLLRSLEPLIAPQVKRQKLRYTYDGVDDTVSVWADREKVEQILLNLLSNAIKFTPPGGSVTLVCRAGAEQVSIQVRDTGVGIPPEKLQRVFEPFVQLDQSLTRSRDGVGLGLAISRDLARGMGGDLTAHSVQGDGSIFTLTLPNSQRPQAE
jgi:signal transduction histidine kinase